MHLSVILIVGTIASYTHAAIVPVEGLWPRSSAVTQCPMVGYMYPSQDSILDNYSMIIARVIQGRSMLTEFPVARLLRKFVFRVRRRMSGRNCTLELPRRKQANRVVSSLRQNIRTVMRQKSGDADAVEVEVGAAVAPAAAASLNATRLMLLLRHEKYARSIRKIQLNNAIWRVWN
jgi:hypothetical protein